MDTIGRRGFLASLVGGIGWLAGGMLPRVKGEAAGFTAGQDDGLPRITDPVPTTRYLTEIWTKPRPITAPGSAWSIFYCLGSVNSRPFAEHPAGHVTLIDTERYYAEDGTILRSLGFAFSDIPWNHALMPDGRIGPVADAAGNLLRPEADFSAIFGEIPPDGWDRMSTRCEPMA